MHKTPEEWARVDPDAALGRIEALDLLAMALQDIAELARQLDEAEGELSYIHSAAEDRRFC